MFSVGIIIPGWHYWANPCRIQPIYEMYFATVIESRFSDNEVGVYIFDLRGIREDQQPYHIPECDLYLYWIAKTGDYSEIQNVVTQLRLAYPEAKHAAGGTHVDIFPEECSKQFDSIVRGPGEESFINIIKDCRDGLTKKVYRSDYKDIRYGDYPFMRRHFLPETAVVNNLLFEKYGENIRSTCVLFSRGCIFKCGFCVYNVPSVIQERSPKSIEEEIQYLKNEYRVEAINLKDEICLPLSKKIAIPYYEAIGHSDVMWRGQTSVVGADEEMIRLASESGCVELAIGVESVSQQVLDVISKKISIDQVREFIRLCKKYNIKVKVCLIFGLPGEPLDIVERTRRFIEETMPDYVSLSGLDPVPGSEMYKNPEYYGFKYIDKDWGKHAHLLYRFSDEEEVGIPFEYEETSRWGKPFSKAEIIKNIQEMQQYLRERNMTY